MGAHHMVIVNIPANKLGNMCAWVSCRAKFIGDAPEGWTWIWAYRAKQPSANFLDIPDQDVMRDCVLCPEHARTLDAQLKRLSGKIGAH